MCKTIIIELSECDSATLYKIIAKAEYPIGSDEAFVGHDVLCEIEEQLSKDDEKELPAVEIKFNPNLSKEELEHLKEDVFKDAMGFQLTRFNTYR